MSMEYPPNQTLYINNLNEKVKKEGKKKEKKSAYRTVRIEIWSDEKLFVDVFVTPFFGLFGVQNLRSRCTLFSPSLERFWI